MFHKKVFRDNLNYPSILPFRNALETPAFGRKQDTDTGISCRAKHDRPTYYFYLSLVAKQPQAINRRREGHFSENASFSFLPCHALPFPSAANEATRLPFLFRLPTSLSSFPRNNHVYSAINSTSLRPNNSVHQQAPSPPLPLRTLSHLSIPSLPLK